MRRQRKTQPREPRLATARGAATRARIVEAAADLVYRRGASATSLEDIMEASATSKSQLYHYFADKDALMRAVIEFQTRRVMGVQAAHLDTVNSLAGLRRWRDAVVTMNRATRGVGGCPLGSLASAALRSVGERAGAAGARLRPVGIATQAGLARCATRRAQARGGPGRTRDRGDRRAAGRPPVGANDALEPAARTRARHGDRPHRPPVGLSQAANPGAPAGRPVDKRILPRYRWRFRTVESHSGREDTWRRSFPSSAEWACSCSAWR